jgi:predicted translin family RNA/ssDNA-binding protein
VESCPYPELVERVRQIDQTRFETHDEATRLCNEIEEHAKAISTHRAQAEQSTYRPHQIEYLDRAKHRESRLAETQAKLRETLKRADDLGKAGRRDLEQMLMP